MKYQEMSIEQALPATVACSTTFSRGKRAEGTSVIPQTRDARILFRQLQSTKYRVNRNAIVDAAASRFPDEEMKERPQFDVTITRERQIRLASAVASRFPAHLRQNARNFRRHVLRVQTHADFLNGIIARLASRRLILFALSPSSCSIEARKQTQKKKKQYRVQALKR